ncbi:MAG: SPFH domain-containing protein [Planctomycetes bacterium]|nr:SPFH domain-containing protein [Planctomycetota bacterium]
MIRETERRAPNGLALLLVPFALLGLEVWAFVREVQALEGGGGSVVLLIAICLAMLGTLLSFRGFFVVNPNQARVLQLFGDYRGTVRAPGLRFANPLYLRRAVSLRVRNFESEKLKVNDHVGNPIEIATIVVWRVVDTAEALFQVDDYVQFVRVQSEAALRNLSTRYAYDSYVEGEHSLRSHTAEIAEELKKEVQGRLAEAGVEIQEARISHLAYAPEIASEMLRRQQASAIVAARQKIVEGAVGMVEMALDLLSKKKVIDLDEERKAAMVSNLLVVLCGDRPAHPVVNAGTLYS